MTAQISCGFRSPFRQGAHIVGSDGQVWLDDPWKPGDTGQRDTRILFSGKDGQAQTIVIPATNPYLGEVEAMEACILDGAEPVVPLSLSRDFLRSVLAIYESASTERPVKP